ncbi:MAG: hypothetical protein IPP81_09225 [Chitinophagaceae bacterium]|nr:hypothetical protein [Chitinophagaceae bacterium]
MKIPAELFPTIYQISKKVYEKTYTLTDGSKILADQHGMNVNSARDYINNFKYLMQGHQFKRTLSAPSMYYFIDQIRKDYGAEQYKKALIALDLHIHYYESCHSGELNKLRQILKKHYVR